MQSAFAHRDVKLDGKRVKADVHVVAGQQIDVFCMEEAADPLAIVYEDDDFMAIMF